MRTRIGVVKSLKYQCNEWMEKSKIKYSTPANNDNQDYNGNDSSYNPMLFYKHAKDKYFPNMSTSKEYKISVNSTGLYLLAALMGAILAYASNDFLKEFLGPYIQRTYKLLGRKPEHTDHINYVNGIDAYDNRVLFDQSALYKLDYIVGENEKEIQIVEINGIEGSGKTQLAINFSQLYYKNKKDRSPKTPRTVVFFPSEEEKILEKEYRIFAKALGIDSENLPISGLIQQVNLQLKTRPNWLVIFDNIKDYNYVKQFFPGNGKGCIIITSRDSQITHNSEITSFDINKSYGFSKNDSIRLLSLLLSDTYRDIKYNHEILYFLAKNVGFLPLAIKRASAYIINSYEAGIPLQKAVQNYINIFRQTAKIASDKQYLTYNDSELIYETTYNLLLDKIDSVNSNDIIKILFFLSFVNSNKINIRLISEMFQLTDINLISLLQALENLYIIEPVEDDYFKVHGTLKKYLIKWYREKHQNESTITDIEYAQLRNILTWFKKEFPLDIRSPEKQIEAERFSEHTSILFEKAKPLIKMAVEKKDYEYLLSVLHMLDATANYYSSIKSELNFSKMYLLEAKNLIEEEILHAHPFKKDSNISELEIFSCLKEKEILFIKKYARVLYSLARIYFYVKEDTSNTHDYQKIMPMEEAYGYVKMAEKLIQLYNTEKTKLGHKKDFEAILYQMNGTLYFELESHDMEIVENAISSYKSILNDETTYDNNGVDLIVKYDSVRGTSDAGAYSRMVCNDQIAKANHALTKIANENPVINWKNMKLRSKFNLTIFNSLKYVDKDLCYHNALEHSLQALGICSESGWEIRMPIYLNTLAETLLLNKKKYLLKDKAVYKKILEQYGHFDEYENNISIAEKLLKYNIKKYGNNKGNFSFWLADAHSALGRIYLENNLYNEAEKEINKCIHIQRKFLKRPDIHSSVLSETALLSEIRNKRSHQFVLME